ncbi:MAG: DUF502 domain-containing protein [Bacteroidota bacterium]
MKKLIKYFLQGLLYIVPIAITLWVIYKVFIFIDGIILKLEIPYLDIPGMGVIIILVLITLVGYLGQTIIAKPIFSYFDNIIEKAPLIKVIYSAIKDLLSAFVGSKKRFNQPVMVKLNRNSEVQKLGFITQSDLTELGLGKDKVAVYLPHSYAWSGNQFIVPKENVTPIKASATTIMKFIVSGGITEIEDSQVSALSEGTSKD